MFNIIYTDVPWTYRNKNTGGSLKSGASYVYGADNKYSTMTIEDLKKMPVPLIASNDAVLFFWVTTNMQEEASSIINQWGFKYKTKIYWYKNFGGNKMGMGFWLRNMVEELWICIKGKIGAFHYQKPNIVRADVGKHSQKPEVFVDYIMDCTKNISDRKCIELFARQRREGWTCLGFELDGMDINDSMKQLYM